MGPQDVQSQLLAAPINSSITFGTSTDDADFTGGAGTHRGLARRESGN
jgi:hypothetical protein